MGANYISDKVLVPKPYKKTLYNLIIKRYVTQLKI